MFLTDIGLFFGTLWHVHAMVFNMSSICVSILFFISPGVFNILYTYINILIYVYANNARFLRNQLGFSFGPFGTEFFLILDLYIYIYMHDGGRGNQHRTFEFLQPEGCKDAKVRF